MTEYRNITNYPIHILKSYSINSQNYLAEQAIINKDYYSLKHLMNAINSERKEISSLISNQKGILNNSTNTTENNITSAKINELEILSYPIKSKAWNVNFSALQDAVDELDPKSVEIILEHSKDIVFDSSCGLDVYFSMLLNGKFIEEKDIEVKRNKIVNLLLKFIPKELVTISNFHSLSEMLSKEEFESFCQSKNITIEDEKYKSLNLNHYRIEDNGPILKTTNMDPIDLLLSRTYAEDINVDKVKSIYKTIYDLHPIAKEMLTYTAYLISEHDDIKIIFGKGLTSSYNPLRNVILIDTNFLKEAHFNIESVVIHEIGHYVYDKIFNFYGAPFNIDGIKKLFLELYNEYKEHIKDPYNQDYLTFEAIEAIKRIEKSLSNNEFQKIKEMLETYEAAARKPIDKAAELLKFNISEYAKYNYTTQYTEYFKDNSYIDLFHVNQASGIAIESEFNTTLIYDNLFDNFLRIYLEEEVFCKAENPFVKELSRSEIITWTMEQFFPQMVAALNISSEKMHFLSRIADYVNRGEHLLKEDQVGCYPSVRGVKVKEQYVELIVRSMELKAAGIEEASSFEELDKFHMSFASPFVRAEIEESYKQKFSFFQVLANTLGLDFVGNDTTTEN